MGIGFGFGVVIGIGGRWVSGRIGYGYSSVILFLESGPVSTALSEIAMHGYLLVAWDIVLRFP